MENCILEMEELRGLSWVRAMSPEVSLNREREDSYGLSCIIKLIG
jgi:hypothetical protein